MEREGHDHVRLARWASGRSKGAEAGAATKQLMGARLVASTRSYGTLSVVVRWLLKMPPICCRLTSTDMALTNKRVGSSGKAPTSGWRNVDGKKVFMAR